MSKAITLPLEPITVNKLTATVFQTNLVTRERKEIEITVDIWSRAGYANPANKEVGDVHHSNGTIQHIFRKVPACLFNSESIRSSSYQYALSYE